MAEAHSTRRQEDQRKRKADYQRRWRLTASGQAFNREWDRKSRKTKKRKAQKAAQSAKYRERYPEKVKESKRKVRWQSRHGITEAEYERMLSEQLGKCAICRSDRPGGPKQNTRFSVDHDHASGVIRGLLCFGCNTTLGRLGETKEQVEDWGNAAVGYLKRLQG